MARQPRYMFERVQGSPELEALQDRMAPFLERLSRDAEDTDGATSDAATAEGTSYSAARASDWDGAAPTTTQEALDRIAYHISSGAGAVPIVELP